MKTSLKVICSLLGTLLLISCTAQTNTNLSADEFEKAINKDSVQILDVRTQGEYTSGHIKNTLWANWNDKDEFTRRIAFVDKNKPVYVYCLAGGRSAAAAEKMRAMGFENVYELKGGINAWKAGDKKLEGVPPAKQMTVETFTTAINSSKTVLVDFGAEWCPPCKKMEPVLKQLKNELPTQFKLVKVDGGIDIDVMKAQNVEALPVFIIYKKGKEVWRKQGVVALSELKTKLTE